MVTLYKTVKKTILSRAQINSVVERTLSYAKISLQSDVSVHCVGDMRMKSLNKQYRGKNYSTDVLSFPTEEFGDLGDIFLCIPQISRQSLEFGISQKEECVRMLSHGVLHLVGYDHDTPNKAKKMFALQERVVKIIC